MTSLGKPRRVVILLQELKYGGSQTQALELARGLDPCRYRAQIWTLMSGMDLLPAAAQAGLEVLQLGKASYVWPTALARLAKALGHQRPDLLVLYTGIPNIWGRLLGRLYGVPCIVATCRGSLEPRRQMDILSWRLAHHHVCNAQALKDQLMRQAGVDQRVISVIPNGVDTARFHPAAQAPAAPVVLCLGRLSPEKGQDALLRAFARVCEKHPQAQLWLVGQGPSQASLARLIQTLPCRGRVRLSPATSDAPSLLRQASILALPSRHEGLPNAVLEAMATGLPVVASWLPGVAELVEPQRTGLLAPPGDVGAWAEALSRLLDDPSLGRAWGMAGRQLVLERFSLSAMVQAHQELFDSLLHKRGR